MVIGSIFLLFALAIVVFLFIFLPLLEPSGPDELVVKREVQQQECRRSALLADRDRLLNTLLELDADNELKKIPSDDYARTRAKLVKEAADILRRLDEMNLINHQQIAATAQTVDEDELERMIASRKRELSVSAVSLPNKDGKTTYCQCCGNPLMPGDKYCSVCGRQCDHISTNPEE
jgi:hypothetical protein